MEDVNARIIIAAEAGDSRIIPTGVGKTTNNVRNIALAPDHPHRGGENTDSKQP